MSFVACAIQGATEASAQACLTEAKQVETLRNEAMAAVPGPPQTTNAERSKT
jgi:hypothetical protein